ncbi:MarR family winged helix-turn-helix transcriptional regulator [Denitrobaculum tricleocarpae]|uniref:MarR family transcriptional regulator n=1 Tax=Denitrobaculum tricleocarpae TaxID=2591009 RepID=A0A545U2I7_9PROT|nr:MarR family transcriptional regulator [Denitrobaculum tricleocarpae]TQV83623.1 MarR family transcriptional regulator [Denitrobaculum tricleocarpae]
MDHVDRIVTQWNRERPDLDVAPMALLGRLKRLTLHISREMAETWAEHGLNAASFDVLATLRRAGPPYALSPAELIASTMVTSGTMTNRIDQLEKAGLVARTQSEEDRRSFLISLTGKGFEVIDAAVTAHVETQERLVSGLSERDQRQLNSLVKRFLADFETE